MVQADFFGLFCHIVLHLHAFPFLSTIFGEAFFLIMKIMYAHEEKMETR